jgi:hypothetical protein
MESLGVITVVGVVVLVALILVFLRVRSKDLIDGCIQRRKQGAKVCSRAELVEGRERIAVALALTDDTLYYENPDMQASLELNNIDEIEYDDETATGHSVIGKALRVRSHGHMFEFVLDAQAAREWQTVLPARRVDRATAQAV